MPLLLSKEGWLKGVLGLEIVKDALIPTLRRHYLQKAKEWNTDDDHLNHLLDLGAAKEVKHDKTKRSTWYVNCSECRPILKMIEMAHSRPARLMWMNNPAKMKNQVDNNKDEPCPEEYRLAKIFMPGGYKEIESSKDYSDLDALVILEILKSNTSVWHSSDEIEYLILFRNRLMHSSSNCISANELETSFSKMKKLLQNEKFNNLEECITATEELDKLQEKNIMCEVDESNENWKLAIDIQKQALVDEGIAEPSPEALNILLTKVQNELQVEKNHRQKLKSELAKCEERREVEQRLWQYKQELARTNVEYAQSRLEDSEKKHKMDVEKLEAEIKRLNNELIKYNPSLAGRIAKGTVTGSGVGLIGGPVGAMFGGAAGGVVGGASYFWDKITK